MRTVDARDRSRRIPRPDEAHAGQGIGNLVRAGIGPCRGHIIDGAVVSLARIPKLRCAPLIAWRRTHGPAPLDRSRGALRLRGLRPLRSARTVRRKCPCSIQTVEEKSPCSARTFAPPPFILSAGRRPDTSLPFALSAGRRPGTSLPFALSAGRRPESKGQLSARPQRRCASSPRPAAAALSANGGEKVSVFNTNGGGKISVFSANSENTFPRPARTFTPPPFALSAGRRPESKGQQSARPQPRCASTPRPAAAALSANGEWEVSVFPMMPPGTSA